MAQRSIGNRISLTASLGWTLVLPTQWFIQGTSAEALISWIWVVVLLVPLGYWTFYVAQTDQASDLRGPWTLIWLGTLALLGAGLGLAPHALGLSPTPFREWLAGAFGLLAGAWLASRVRAKREPGIDTVGLDLT
jgi:hypothetical protein